MVSMVDIPHFVEGSILVVCLTRPVAEDAHNKLRTVIDAAAPVSVNTSTSKVEIVQCRQSDRQAEIQRKKTDGSNEQLFATASQAKSLGWTRLAVADNLTYRQIQGDLRFGEKEDLSLVLLQISPKMQDDRSQYARGVLARRLPLNEAICMLAQDENLHIVPWQDHDSRWIEDRIFDEYGMAIHDFDRSLFQPDFDRDELRSDFRRSTSKALSLKPSLPAEVVNAILDKVHAELPLESLTAAPKVMDQKTNVMEVYALVPLVDCEAVSQQLNDAIKSHNANISAVVYPWIGKLPASRRDFVRLWNRIVQENPEPHYMTACFIDSPVSIQKDTLTLARWQYNNPAFVRQVPIKDAVDYWRWFYDYTGLNKASSQLDNSVVKSVELVYEPSARFFNDPPPWKALEERGDAPVFFLFNKKQVSEEKMKKWREDMCNDLGDILDPADYNNQGGPYRYVDWEREEDGGIEDMVNIATECRFHKGGRLGKIYTIFVDRKGFEEETVLFSSYTDNFMLGEESYFPKLYEQLTEDEKLEKFKEGIKVVRVPNKGDLMIQWVNLDIANVGWNEYFRDDVQEFYERTFDSLEEKRRTFKLFQKRWRIS